MLNQAMDPRDTPEQNQTEDRHTQAARLRYDHESVLVPHVTAELIDLSGIEGPAIHQHFGEIADVFATAEEGSTDTNIPGEAVQKAILREGRR